MCSDIPAVTHQIAHLGSQQEVNDLCAVAVAAQLAAAVCLARGTPMRRPRRQTPAPAVRAGRAASSSDSFGWPWARPSATTRICRARMKIPVHLTGRGRWGSIRWSERPSRWGGTPRGGLNLRPMLSAQAAITAQLRQRRLPESHEQYRVSTVRRAAQRPNGVARYTSAIAAFRGTAKAEHLPL
jgi:hypothetical protein